MAFPGRVNNLYMAKKTTAQAAYGIAADELGP